jgi:hypothetical protein
MTKGEALRALRIILVGLYQSYDSIRRVADDAGVNAVQISFQGSPTDVWHGVLLEAAKSGRIGGIVEIAGDEYGEFAGKLAQAHQAYLDAGQPQPEEPAGGGKSYGTRIDTGGGAYIGGNVNLGGGDFVGRDKIIGGAGSGSAAERAAGQPGQQRRALQAELEQHQGNLARLRAQKAVYALGEEPLRLLNQIEHEEQEIARIQAELQGLGA